MVQVTQLINGVRGVHALLPYDAVRDRQRGVVSNNRSPAEAWSGSGLA